MTPMGLVEAARLTRQHRLWELYLITYADVAPGLVDSGADAIEHVLEPQVIAELEAQLATVAEVPQSPHDLSVRAVREIESIWIVGNLRQARDMPHFSV